MSGAANGVTPAPDGRALDIALLLAVWAAAVALVGPHGEFPLNDDWAYALSVRQLVDDGVFRPPGWAAPTLLSQALWGAAATLPAGFSFTALRLSTLLLGAATVVGIYLLARELRAPRGLAHGAALSVAFGPVFFALSHTFMTDVPFTAFAVLALLCYARALRRGADRDLGLGIAFTLAAVLCRQTGLFLPLAFAVAMLGYGHGTLRQRLPRAVLPLLLGGAALWLLGVWLAHNGTAPDGLGVADVMAAWQLRGNPSAAVRLILGNLMIALLYTGLFLAPALLRYAPGWRVGHRRLQWSDGLAAATLVIALLVLWSWGRRMPLRGNVLISSGVGPITLYDWYTVDLAHNGPLPAAFWIAVTAVSLVGAALLVAQVGAACARLWHTAGSDPSAGARALLLLGSAVYLGAVCIVIPFDRYYLPLAAMLAAALVPPAPAATGRVTQLAAAALLAAMAVFSIAATHDYLSWNRARWRGLHQLTEVDGIAPRRIDGGAEFNGLHLYARDFQKRPGKSWWWVEDDEWMLTMGPVKGYSIARRYPYSRWLPPGDGEIDVLQRGGG